MAKTLIKTFPAGTDGYEILLADTITVADYAIPKSFIFSSTDSRDYVTIMRWNDEDSVYDSVTDGEGDLQLNDDNKDVTLVTPDQYGAMPNQPTYGIINLWKVE